MFIWTTYPQTFPNNRKVLRGGVWKDVVVRAPLWERTIKEEEEAEVMVEEKCVDEVEEEEEEEMEEMPEDKYENTHWRMSERGTMVCVRRRSGNLIKA